MAISDIFQMKRKNFITLENMRKREVQEETVECPKCHGSFGANKLSENKGMCPDCNHYFTLSVTDRIKLVADEKSFKEMKRSIKTKDPLNFPEYISKIEANRKKCNTQDAMTIGVCKINGITTAIGVLDSNFLMGSMGTVVGEKVTQITEFASKMRLPLVIFSASGGARMQEGIFSLMQMVKTSAAIERFQSKGGLFISVLTNPTTGGVSASYAMLGDIIIAEPDALICFAGPRVIEQTIGEKLPDGFQKSEFLLEHGMIDSIVERNEMKSFLYRVLLMHQKKRR